ncbi:hypothetical protein DJ018_00775 [Phenylobacterium deserti]|uniref:Nucleotidyltransferase family protein n=2 Tax=Phenylobacterium deserti TaxID=1914756 RepID=A0A328ANN0_9CAUL|nr:hypothetical protein DJ018_00775 [Phenylobacterium deserti]
MAGRPPHNCDWTAVMSLANRSLITPQLAIALAPVRQLVPAEVGGFLDEVLGRNRERNRRLWRQLNDGVAALNGAGIMPVLLKGAARWAGLPRDATFDRLLSDVDVLVEPAQVQPAMAALQAAGFSVLNRYEGSAVHVVAEFGRPEIDVGYLDLHQRPPGPPGVAGAPALAARRRTIALDSGWAQTPDAASQILYLVLHDQFHDGDYWRGGFDLRHLTDLAALAPQLSAEDWAWLQDACGTPLVRAALAAQLVAASRLAGAPLPAWADTHRARWTYRRWRIQYARPALRLPLAAAAAALEWRDVRRHGQDNRSGRRRVLGDGERTAPPESRLNRIGRIFTAEMGKI